MNYSNIIPCDIANGEGARISLFVSGCRFHCHGCFNQDAQDFDYGKPYTDATEEYILALASAPYISGVSILGGDPLWQDNEGIQKLKQLVDRVHSVGKTVWLWTGFKWEDIHWDSGHGGEYTLQGLVDSCDVVVDGPFIEEQKDLSLAWRGSANQRVIDVSNTVQSGKIQIYQGGSPDDKNA